MGENAFASSDQGLQPNEQVRLNGQDDLSKVIRGHHDACVYGVALTAAPGDPGKYVLTVDGQGPQAEKTGSLYLEFVDAAGKTLVRYDLVLTAGKRATYTVPLRRGGQAGDQGHQVEQHPDRQVRRAPGTGGRVKLWTGGPRRRGSRPALAASGRLVAGRGDGGEPRSP